MLETGKSPSLATTPLMRVSGDLDETRRPETRRKSLGFDPFAQSTKRFPNDETERRVVEERDWWGYVFHSEPRTMGVVAP